MSEGNLEKSGLQNLLSPSVLVLIVGIIGYLVAETPLTSDRPETTPGMSLPSPPSLAGMTAIHARLWDDPLGLACEHSRGEEKPLLPRELAQLFSRVSPEKEGFGKTWSFLEIVENIVDKAPRRKGADQEHAKQKLAGKVLCLPILVSGEPYEGDAEQRRRTTYAALAALTACGFELAYPDRLSYITLTIGAVDRATQSDIATTLAIPVKLFQKTQRHPQASGQGARIERQAADAPDAVLAMWINEAQLGARPLAAIGQILKQLFEPIKPPRYDLDDCLALHILGPSDSDVLLDMAEEDWGWKGEAVFSEFADPILYSGRATIFSRSVAALPGAPSFTTMLENFADGTPAHCGLRVVRTIGTDESLIKLLARELWLRGAWPGKADPLPNAAGGSQPRDPGKYVVLLTEFDTLFGRTLPQTFRDAFPEIFAQPQEREDDALQVFDYLRGIDGEQPKRLASEEKSGERPGAGEAMQFDPLRAPSQDVILASGPSQLDYIRRLESYLVDFHAGKRQKGEQGIVAIGVVGSDIYDKLLLLRALRGHFPEACFFSTDCDAEFCLEREYPTTRNLIVASHFALQLHPDLQRGAPVFRDSYQTAAYFQGLLALRDARIPEELQTDPWNLAGGGEPSLTGLEPLAFEVARHGLYQLSIPADGSPGSAAVHPSSPRQRRWLLGAFRLLWLALAAGATLWIATLAVTQIRLAWQPCLFGLLAIAILVGTAMFDSGRANGEPLTALSGISVWIPNAIRLAAFLLSAALLYKAIANLRREGTRHDELVLSDAEQAALQAEMARPARVREWLAGGFRLAAWPGGVRSAKALYHEYRVLGEWPRRLLRSVAFALPYLVFGFAIMRLEDAGGQTSARGDLARGLGAAALLLAVIALVALTAWAYDAMELCRRFVKHAAARKPDWSRAAPGLTALRQERSPLDEDDARELLTIKLIARHTRVVGKLVAYPFWPVLLLILSRHPSFDYFPIPISLLVLWGLALAGSILFASGLRLAAGQARGEVLSRLNDSLSTCLGSTDESAPRRTAQLRQFIADVQRERGGAFQPLMQDPIITALATLLGGTGGLLLIEQLLPYK